MTKSILDSIRKLLHNLSITFKELHHEPTPTSQDSARVRGEDISTGGKALVLKVGTEFKLFVIRGDQRIDAKKLKEHFNVKKVRFATPDELFELTGLIPGSVPPFGKPILPLELYVEKGITLNTKIAFNAGSVTDSIIMEVDNYLKSANPKEIFEFRKKE
jgi:Ala-tRNA(Pro) deacylase